MFEADLLTIMFRKAVDDVPLIYVCVLPTNETTEPFALKEPLFVKLPFRVKE